MFKIRDKKNIISTCYTLLHTYIPRIQTNARCHKTKQYLQAGNEKFYVEEKKILQKGMKKLWRMQMC